MAAHNVKYKSSAQRTAARNAAISANAGLLRTAYAKVEVLEGQLACLMEALADVDLRARVLAIVPCLAAQKAAAIDGRPSYTSRMLVTPDQHVLANAARHAFADKCFSQLSPADARKLQRGRPLLPPPAPPALDLTGAILCKDFEDFCVELHKRVDIMPASVVADPGQPSSCIRGSVIDESVSFILSDGDLSNCPCPNHHIVDMPCNGDGLPIALFDDLSRLPYCNSALPLDDGELLVPLLSEPSEPAMPLVDESVVTSEPTQISDADLAAFIVEAMADAAPRCIPHVDICCGLGEGTFVDGLQHLPISCAPVETNSSTSEPISGPAADCRSVAKHAATSEPALIDADNADVISDHALSGRFAQHAATSEPASSDADDADDIGDLALSSWFVQNAATSEPALVDAGCVFCRGTKFYGFSECVHCPRSAVTTWSAQDAATSEPALSDADEADELSDHALSVWFVQNVGISEPALSDTETADEIRDHAVSVRAAESAAISVCVFCSGTKLYGFSECVHCPRSAVTECVFCSGTKFYGFSVCVHCPR